MNLMNLQGDMGARKLIEKYKNLAPPQSLFPKELLILTQQKITMNFIAKHKNWLRKLICITETIKRNLRHGIY